MRAVPPSTLFDSRYELVEHLGSGHFGEVWRAKDTRRAQKVVAIKILEAGSSPDAAWREASSLTRLQSPFILGVNNASIVIDVPYLDTDYVAGGTVASAIAPTGVVPFRAVKWTRQLCTAVEHCHNMQVIHRDIRPENVFRRENDDIQLGDFGVAAAMDVDGKASSFGHMDARAPEVCWNYQTSAQSDVWSIGAFLYSALAGQKPRRDTASNIAEDIREVCPHVSGQLGRTIRAALKSHPGERTQSARELGASLASIRRSTRDFRRIVPHSGHLRCWSGTGVSSAKNIFVCTLRSGRGVRITATYQSSGRRVSTLTDVTTTPSKENAQLRRIFDTLR